MLYSPSARATRSLKLFGLGIGLGATGGNGTIPQPTIRPAITGITVAGDVLTVSNGTWNANPPITSYAYQWYSGLTPVGTNANTYTLQNSDVGNYILVAVTAKNAYYTTEVFTLSVGPVSASASGPQVRGTPATGSIANGTVFDLPTAQSGDYFLMVIVANTQRGNGPGTPAGWTLVASQAAGSGNSTLYAFVKAEAGSDTFVSTQSVAAAAYSSYAIENCASGYDVSATATGTSGTITAPSVTPTGLVDLLVSCFGTRGIGPTIGTPSGGITATPNITSATVTLVTGYETLVGSGATTARTASTTGTEWEGIAIAFK